MRTLDVEACVLSKHRHYDCVLRRVTLRDSIGKRLQRYWPQFETCQTFVAPEPWDWYHQVRKRRQLKLQTFRGVSEGADETGLNIEGWTEFLFQIRKVYCHKHNSGSIWNKWKPKPFSQTQKRDKPESIINLVRSTSSCGVASLPKRKSDSDLLQCQDEKCTGTHFIPICIVSSREDENHCCLNNGKVNKGELKAAQGPKSSGRVL